MIFFNSVFREVFLEVFWDDCLKVFWERCFWEGGVVFVEEMFVWRTPHFYQKALRQRGRPNELVVAFASGRTQLELFTTSLRSRW